MLLAEGLYYLTIGSLVWSGSKKTLFVQRRSLPVSSVPASLRANPRGQCAEAVQSFRYCSPSSSSSKEKREVLPPHMLSQCFGCFAKSCTSGIFAWYSGPTRGLRIGAVPLMSEAFTGACGGGCCSEFCCWDNCSAASCFLDLNGVSSFPE